MSHEDMFVGQILSFLNLSHPCVGINAREYRMARPPEPYYGREIGKFTEFAHGIRVSEFINFHVLFNCTLFSTGRRLCSR